MSQQLNKYKFDNLQPITFLRKFNKMVQQDIKHPIRQNKNQLKIYPLSKFPLPQFYYKMEGIFETGTKKKDVVNFNIKSKEDIQDEEFLVKHRNFMTKAIQKIIKENEDQQQNLQKYKIQYDTNRKVESVPKKSLSEHKLKPSIKIRSTSGRNQNQNIIQSQKISNTDTQIPQQSKTYLQKIQIQRLQSLRNVKKQKIRIKNKQKIDQFINSRKNFYTTRNEKESKNSLNQIKTGRTVQYNNITAQDWKKSFVQGLFDLQKQQNRYKYQYSSNIEKQIRRFNEKADSSIQKTKNQKFW